MIVPYDVLSAGLDERILSGEVKRVVYSRDWAMYTIESDDIIAHADFPGGLALVKIPSAVADENFRPPFFTNVLSDESMMVGRNPVTRQDFFVEMHPSTFEVPGASPNYVSNDHPGVPYQQYWLGAPQVGERNGINGLQNHQNQNNFLHADFALGLVELAYSGCPHD